MHLISSSTSNHFIDHAQSSHNPAPLTWPNSSQNDRGCPNAHAHTTSQVAETYTTRSELQQSPPIRLLYPNRYARVQGLLIKMLDTRDVLRLCQTSREIRAYIKVETVEAVCYSRLTIFFKASSPFSGRRSPAVFPSMLRMLTSALHCSSHSTVAICPDANGDMECSPRRPVPLFLV